MAILISLESTTFDENLELVNLTCVTYAQPTDIYIVAQPILYPYNALQC